MKGEYCIRNVPGDPPTTFYIADAPSLVDANIIWKCDPYTGVSVSEDGLDGPFTTASEDLTRDILEERRRAIEMEDVCRAAVANHWPAAWRRSVPVDTGHAAGNGRGSVIAAIYRACAILMVLLVVMLTGAWAEGLQCWWEAWTIAGICTVVAYLMLRGAGDV